MISIDRQQPVLIVDDFRTMLRLLRKQLHHLGFEDIDEARDGAAALDRLKAGSYGLVISDWSMTPMSGLELLQAVRAEDTLQDLPFVLLTPDESAQTLAQARDAGASSCLAKPIDPARLHAELTPMMAVA